MLIYHLAYNKMTKARYRDIREGTLCNDYPNCKCNGHYVWEKNKKLKVVANNKNMK
jgi:hypothetical protein